MAEPESGRSPFDTTVVQPAPDPADDTGMAAPSDTGTDTGTDADTSAVAAGSGPKVADDVRDGASEAPGRRRLPLLVVVAAVILIADVVSKWLVVKHLANRAPVDVIPSVLDLQLTRNAGAAFGFAAGATVIFTVVAAAVVVAIVRAARNLVSLGWAWALGLLLGGALGNLGDRLFRDPGPLRGHVVDWIHLHQWPVFNLADSAIVIGGMLAVVLSLQGRRIDGSRGPEADLTGL